MNIFDNLIKTIAKIILKFIIAILINIAIIGFIAPELFSAKNDLLVLLSIIAYLSLIPFNFFIFYKEIKWLFYKIRRRTKNEKN